MEYIIVVTPIGLIMGEQKEPVMAGSEFFILKHPRLLQNLQQGKNVVLVYSELIGTPLEMVIPIGYPSYEPLDRETIGNYVRVITGLYTVN